MFSIGQQVIVHSDRQVTGKGYRAASTKVMEIASELIEVDNSSWGIESYKGYRLRKVGSKSKGGQVVWNEADIEAI